MIASVEILMDDSYFNSYISVGSGTLKPEWDDKIFFYVDSKEDLQSLMEEENGEDFIVTKIYDWYEPEEIFA